jgi:hypothetical protein
MTHFSVFAKNDYEKWQQGLFVADTQDGFNLVSSTFAIDIERL